MCVSLLIAVTLNVAVWFFFSFIIIIFFLQFKRKATIRSYCSLLDPSMEPISRTSIFPYVYHHMHRVHMVNLLQKKLITLWLCEFL